MVVSERHLFNRLSGNTDNELGTALHPIVRHTLFTQGAKSFKTRDKGASPRWKCNGTVLLGVSCLVTYSQSKGQYRDTTLQPGVARKAFQRKKKIWEAGGHVSESLEQVHTQA